MTILVFGAGSLGSLLAARLKESGQDVSLLARGERLFDLRQHGVILEDMITGERTTTHLNVVEQLTPEDFYDLIVVVMGKHHVTEVLPVLAANKFSPNVLFMGNNIAGSGEMIAALGSDRVLQGFLSAAGTVRGPIAHYVLEMGGKKGTSRIGEPDGKSTERTTQIAATFEGAGFPTAISSNIDAWLKCHGVLIVSLGGAFIATGRNIQRLVRTRDALILMVRGIREGLQVVQALGLPILPPMFKAITWVPEPILVSLVRRMLQNPAIEYGLVHADAAHTEIQHLVGELLTLARLVGIPTPALEHLSAAREPGLPEIPIGSAEIPLDWRGVWIAVSAASALIALTGLALGIRRLSARRVARRA